MKTHSHLLSDSPTHSAFSVSLPVVLIPPLLGCLCPKGQVTRAQEAEENYLVKRELATVKQQSEEVTAQLERARKTISQLQQQPQAVSRGTEKPRMARRRGTPCIALEAAYSSDLGVRFGFKLSDNCLKMNVVWKQLEVQIMPCPKV